MRTYREMRRDAWKIVTGSSWMWRLIVNYAVLIAIAVGVMAAVVFAFQAAGIQTWESFRAAAAEAKRNGLELAVPSAREAWRMTLASAFATVVQYLFYGIGTFGIVTTLLKCIKNDTSRWFSDAFGGFRRPFEMLWLMLLMMIKIMLWTLLFIIPGIIAGFRYMLSWYIKAENPEMSASACIKRSSELMQGRKLHMLGFSLSYLGWFLLAVVPYFAGWFVAVSVAEPCGQVAALAAVLGGMLTALPFFVFALIYSAVGKAIFYRDAKAESEGSAEQENPSVTSSVIDV